MAAQNKHRKDISKDETLHKEFRNISLKASTGKKGLKVSDSVRSRHDSKREYCIIAPPPVPVISEMRMNLPYVMFISNDEK